ncbi:MAG: hypothetical protein IJQ37_06180 [Clostridia bacterium]|nr:hypothetical protein [Clostridia bacterium]
MENTLRGCPVCRSKASCFSEYQHDSVFYDCPVCGRYELTLNGFRIQHNNHLAPYLYYNRFKNGLSHPEYRYHTTMGKELCDTYKNDFEKGDTTNGHPVHMDDDVVNNWYPKSFSERIDSILIRVSSLAKHIGHPVKFDNQEMLSLLFVDRKELPDDSDFPHKDSYEWREDKDCLLEADYVLDYLKERGYVKDYLHLRSETGVELTLTPKGYARVDELQKNTSYGRNALVAMKFGEDTLTLREAIRKGITDAGYNAVFIDEVEHIDFITPELLKYIQESKFVVVDLTHQNNGAYFEEGYAMGLGKPVIQLCQDGIRLHFDIAQKNTIMWKTECDIPQRLTNRIKATID